MTKEKKFKRRVRARMKTGQRYTEARAELEGGRRTRDPEPPTLEDLYEDLYTEYKYAKYSPPHETRIAHLVADFHRAHGLREPWTVLAAHVLDVLRGEGADEVKHDSLQKLFEAWKQGAHTPPIFRLFQTNDEAREAVRAYKQSLLPTPLEPIEQGDLQDHEDDEDWFESNANPSSDHRLLDHLWKRDPDVGWAFKRPAHSNDDASQRPQALLERGADELIDGIQDVYVASRMIKIGDQEFESVHGGEADELIRYAQEIQRLRSKLAEAGIDPDVP